MQYFITEQERDATYYHEWAKGRFDGVSFWQSDSLLLSDDLLVSLGLERLFRSVIPDYDPDGETAVTAETWQAVCAAAEQIGGETAACIREACAWADETFAEFDVFTMIGM